MDLDEIYEANQTQYQWVIFEAELKHALKDKSDAALETFLGSKPRRKEMTTVECWPYETGEKFILNPELARLIHDYPDQPLLAFKEIPLFKGWKLTEHIDGNTIAIRRYSPIYAKSLLKQDLETRCLEIEIAPDHYDRHPYPGEDFANYYVETPPNLIVPEATLRYLFELAGAELPSGMTACDALTLYRDGTTDDNSPLLQTINNACQKTYGRPFSPNVVTLPQKKNQLKEITVDGHFFFPIIGINQTIHFTKLGEKLLALGIKPFRTAESQACQDS